MAVAQHPGDLLGGAGQDHHHGQLAGGGETVGLEHPHLVPVVDDRLRMGKDPAQARDDLGAAGQDGGIRLGHTHVTSPCGFGPPSDDVPGPAGAAAEGLETYT